MAKTSYFAPETMSGDPNTDPYLIERHGGQNGAEASAEERAGNRAKGVQIADIRAKYAKRRQHS